MAKQQFKIETWMVVVVIAVIFFYGGSEGWFKGVTQIDFSQYPGTISPTIITNTPTDPTCTISFDKSTAYVGEDVTGTIRDGALKRCVVAYNYENTGWAIYNVETLDVTGVVTATSNTDVPGTYVWTAVCGYFEGENFIAECRTNDATIEIILRPEDEPPEEEGIGDIIDTSGGSGSVNYGESDSTIIDVEGWTTGGPWILGARIHRDWWYIDPQNPDCYGPFPEVITWTFWDSNRMAWQVYDTVPISISDEVCPVVYHPDAPWIFEINNNKPNCEIGYTWSITAYICEEA